MGQMMDPAMKRYALIVGEMDSVYHDYSLKMGFSDSGMRILYTVCIYGEGCLLSDIIRLSGISKQTVNSALRKLEADGVLYLEETEKRRKRVVLTEKGNQIVQDKVLPLVEIEKAILAGWPEGEREQYLSLTQRYLNTLREKVEEI